MVIVTHRFQKVPFSKCFLSTRKRKSSVLKFLCHLLCNLVVMAVTAPFTSVISNSLSMSVGGLVRGRECVSSCFCIQKKAF